LFLVGSYTIATTSDGVMGIGLAAFLVWAIWIIVTSVIMYQTKDVAA
jgi:hypothetical protein